MAAGHLVLRPLHEMIERLGEQAPLETGSGLLRGGVVHLLEHAGHAQQIRGLEATQVGEQPLGAGDIADHAMRADGHVLDVPREAVRQRKEQQQTARLVQHVVEYLIAVVDRVVEVAVRQHHALRFAGGARRVHDGEQVVGADAADRLVQFLVADGLAEIGDRVEAVRLEVEHVAQALAVRANLLKDLRMRVVAGEGDDRFDLCDDITRLLGRISLVYGDAHRADGGAGEVHDAPLIAGGGVYHDHAAGLDPEAEKPLGHLTDAVVHLAGGHVMPLPRLIVLPLGDEVIGVAFATLGEQ